MNTSPVTFDSLGREFIKSLRVRNLSDNTIKGIEWKLGKFISYLESRSISEVTAISREVVATFQVELYERINQQGQPNGVSHQNRMLSTVKLFMAYLKEYDYIVSDPAKDIRYAKEPKSLPQGILTPTEARGEPPGRTSGTPFIYLYLPHQKPLTGRVAGALAGRRIISYISAPR